MKKNSKKSNYEVLLYLENNVHKAQRELETFKKQIEEEEKLSNKVLSVLKDHSLSIDEFLKKVEKTFEKSKQGEAYTDEPKEYI